MSTVTSVGTFEAKTHLSALLERVANGETIEITRRGIPVARLVPHVAYMAANFAEAVSSLRELRRGKTLGAISVRELIDEGRRRRKL